MSNYNVGDLIPVKDTLLALKVNEEIEPSIKFVDTSDQIDTYVVNTSGTFDLENGQPLRVIFKLPNTGPATILIDEMQLAIPIVRSIGVPVVANDLFGKMILLYDSVNGLFEAFPYMSITDKLKLQAINENANEYTHPLTHSVSMITGALSEAQIDQKIADLVNGAPGTLDTLNEIATALGNDPNLATTLTNQIAGKVTAADYPNLSQFKEITSTFLLGQTQLVINDAFITENSCSVVIQFEGNKTGIWDASYVDGILTITSTIAEVADIPVKVFITKS